MRDGTPTTSESIREFDAVMQQIPGWPSLPMKLAARALIFVNQIELIMSLTQDHSDHVFQCDGKGCHATLETGTPNFTSAQNILHRNLWKAKLINRDWTHLCPQCQGTLI